MATITRDVNKDIAIAVDPGYDATKVCINGVTFKIPNNVLDITGHSQDFLTLGDKKADSYICSHYIKDKEYLIGELARKSIKERSAHDAASLKYQMMDSYERFQTMDFEVNLMTVIGLALVEYAKATMRNQWKPELTIIEDTVDDENGKKQRVYRIPSIEKSRIVIGVALPNDAVSSAWKDIIRFIVGKHHYAIDTLDGRFDLNYEILPGHAMAASQVICALLGAASDDNGKIDPESTILKELPAVVIDGGYKTVGIFMLTQAHQVASAQSNTDYAMGNAHKAVAARLKNEYGRKNIEAFSIPSILDEGGKINCLVKDENDKQSVIEVDVAEMVYEEQKKLCNGLIQMLNEKFDDLLDVKEIVITGGTGAAYYHHISTYMKEERGHLSDAIILTDYKFRGKKLEPVYAIAVGMYKSLRDQLRKANAKKDEVSTAKDGE